MPMPDMDHSVTFWQDVANTFKNNTAVIFDLFNEPYPDSGAWDSTAGWTCWRVKSNIRDKIF
jgi:endoglucanase